MEWKIHGERPIYRNRWVNLWLLDVEQPDGHRFEHHVVRMRSLAATVVLNERREVLMLWRHRFITNVWGWELPMGLLEDGETPEQAAAREVEEETGWRPNGLRPLAYSQPANGITDSEHHLFRAESATYVGPPTEANESDRVEWVALSEIRSMIDRHEIVSGATLLGLMHTMLEELSPQVAEQSSGP